MCCDVVGYVDDRRDADSELPDCASELVDQDLIPICVEAMESPDHRTRCVSMLNGAHLSHAADLMRCAADDGLGM